MQDAQPDTADDPLTSMLRRSDVLQDYLPKILDGASFDASARGAATYSMCTVVLEHGVSLRSLMGMGFGTSAVGQLRLQFEALTRAMWLLYAANELALERLSAPLTPQSELAAKNLPSASEMIEQIGKSVGMNVPAAAHQMLVQFKDMSWHEWSAQPCAESSRRLPTACPNCSSPDAWKRSGAPGRAPEVTSVALAARPYQVVRLTFALTRRA